MTKPKFGLTDNPDEVAKQRGAAAIKAAPASPVTPQQGQASSTEKANEDEPIDQQAVTPTGSLPKFGADTAATRQRPALLSAIFSVQSGQFWTKASVISLIGCCLWWYQFTNIDMPTVTGGVILLANLLLYPFASALLTELVHPLWHSFPQLAYLLAGKDGKSQLSLGGCVLVPIILWLRFMVFIFEWLFGAVLGLIGVLIIAKVTR
ncbi:hypothetical protein ACS4N0_10080 [Levilactobacillus zymae]|uniref:hypothetical protein n=1 Tax=Levilactobacillus zymae TaxID=267363 RepID=UPI003FCD6CEE